MTYPFDRTDLNKYREHLTVDVNKKAFPFNVRYEGEVYSQTGKTGVNAKTGVPSLEYATPSDDRVWRNADGEVSPD